MAAEIKNAILAALPEKERDTVLRNSSRETLVKQRRLEYPNRCIESVYFVEEGVASVIAVTDGMTQVEVGIVGPEGMTGLGILHGVDKAPYTVIVQIEGTALRVPASTISKVMRESARCRNLFLRFAHLFMVQTSQTAITNARATIPQRLARWLLMAQDRIGSPELPLTHKFLSVMMGVRRAGITSALSVLVKQGVIEPRRGSILVLDRDGLKKSASRFYGLTEKEFSKLIGLENTR